VAAADMQRDGLASPLAWISIVSGAVLREHEHRFPRKSCADETLLANLNVVRDALVADGVGRSTAHDLLARLMFVQFLFHRKDAEGHAALTPKWLVEQKESGRFIHSHTNLESVLRSQVDTYALFRLLNERFNGDLFPSGLPGDARDCTSLQQESNVVKQRHLTLLADFVAGTSDLGSGQRSLWPLYAFDVIPLEFISSIYEAFVLKRPGTHYTPSYMVDIVLDSCLPWDSDDWNVKVLDPACGSGIFLVKAFQRLVHRWKRDAGAAARPDAPTLRKLLTENLFGVDIDPEAVRVASFSLYLAMCDELEPRYVWNRVKFPALQGRRLIAADFFREDVPGLCTDSELDRYDVVVGNAPWGARTTTTDAVSWAKERSWPVAYKDVGPLFIAKGAALTLPEGRVSMLQPSSMLFKKVAPAAAFRVKLAEAYAIERIVNLSILRFGLFADAIGPACIVTLCNRKPSGELVDYVVPKPVHTPDDDFRVAFEAYDYHRIDQLEVARDPALLVALVWGGQRDYDLVKKLASHGSLAKYRQSKSLTIRQGIVRGSRAKRNDKLLDVPILEAQDFPDEGYPYLRSDDLPKNTDPCTHRPVDLADLAWHAPQLLIKSGWVRDGERLHARLVDSVGPTLCTELYVTVHAPESDVSLLETACAVFNSGIAVYYLLHTSQRFANYNQEIDVGDLLSVPLPGASVLLPESRDGENDARVAAAFRLKPAEAILIEDALRVTLRRLVASRQTVRRQEYSEAPSEADLFAYAGTFRDVLKHGFGEGRRVGVAISVAESGEDSQFQLVTVLLDPPASEDTWVEHHDLQSLHSQVVHAMTSGSEGVVIYRRVILSYGVRLYRGSRVPVVHICKPAMVPYWTRSQAMRDADVVSTDLVLLARADTQRKSGLR
jgi:hypothetical protein